MFSNLGSPELSPADVQERVDSRIRKCEHDRDVRQADAVVRNPRRLAEPMKQALRSRIVGSDEAGVTTGLADGLRLRNPARRAVFQLLGVYLPERQAREVLRKIHEYKWIEAEKAGFDFWSRHCPNMPLEAAASQWALHYLDDYLQWSGSGVN